MSRVCCYGCGKRYFLYDWYLKLHFQPKYLKLLVPGTTFHGAKRFPLYAKKRVLISENNQVFDTIVNINGAVAELHQPLFLILKIM